MLWNSTSRALLFRQRPGKLGYHLVRILLGFVLFLAAAFKTHELATTPTLGNSLLENRYLLMAVIQFEFFLALWLFSGLYPRLAWKITLGLFSIFAVVTLYKALSGEASCGCLGRVEINPWYTLALDLSAVALLIYCRSDFSLLKRSFTFRCIFARSTALVAVWSLLAISTSWAIASFQPLDNVGDLSLIGQAFQGPDGKKTIVVDPEDWIGKHFPLLPFIENSASELQSGERPLRERLPEGHWFIVLYRHDCSNCLESMPNYERIAIRSVNNLNAPRVALIETSSSNIDARSLPLSSETPCVLGQLNSKWEWFTEPPIVIEIKMSKYWISKAKKDQCNKYITVMLGYLSGPHG